MPLSLYKLAFPAILALLAVGTAGFLLAFSYYPEKHVNVDIDGKCYELLGISNEKHKILRAENEINVKQMQLNMIEHSDTSLPIVFSGSFIIAFYPKISKHQVEFFHQYISIF